MIKTKKHKNNLKVHFLLFQRKLPKKMIHLPKKYLPPYTHSTTQHIVPCADSFLQQCSSALYLFSVCNLKTKERCRYHHHDWGVVAALLPQWHQLSVLARTRKFSQGWISPVSGELTDRYIFFLEDTDKVNFAQYRAFVYNEARDSHSHLPKPLKPFDTNVTQDHHFNIFHA